MKHIRVTVTNLDLGDKNYSPNDFLQQATKQLNTFEYIIYINHITCISSNITGGADIRLSCGKEIPVLDNLMNLEQKIESAYSS
ncbi:hypothetical protein K6T82_10180 [Flavobacterium sp. 17A]|uniref:Uncharacterized protein n=1 Tax=Flavobacterium potami TaxID=2872310 RepID=A0A9X1H9R3_9FLAO|nr:hypothetical protein [Flavobacterium potami]MBZ4035135.1 hypothetical protein [Flavobacterium potami]